ncbi:hypothetical protein ACTQ2N_11075 [Ruminococcus sp. LCP21S3_E8]
MRNLQSKKEQMEHLLKKAFWFHIITINYKDADKDIGQYLIYVVINGKTLNLFYIDDLSELDNIALTEQIKSLIYELEILSIKDTCEYNKIILYLIKKVYSSELSVYGKLSNIVSNNDDIKAIKDNIEKYKKDNRLAITNNELIILNLFSLLHYENKTDIK